MIALDVEDTPVPVWLRRSRDRFRGKEWRKGICWKAALTGIAIVIGIAFLTLLMSSTKYRSIFPGRGAELPISTNPNITYLQPQFFNNLHSERVKIKYGPFAVPGNDVANFQLLNITKPCSDCMITYMQASLDNEDGATANANTGMWLHHIVLLNPTQPDTNKKASYHLTTTSTLLISPELMNETPIPSSVYTTLTYEYIPIPSSSLSPSPAISTFQHVKSIWLDITGACGDSSYPIPEKRNYILRRGRKMDIGYFSGGVVFAATHLHDGGIDVSVLREGEEVCSSVATYGETEGYVENVGMGKGKGMEHVSDMEICTEVGRMEGGEEWKVVVRYDLEERESMRGVDGGLEPVMGIALLYVALDGEEEEDKF